MNVDVDRAGLAQFLRTRRESLQPEDVGLPRSSRRRAPGLRREEIAALSDMSVDYYSRLERERGPQPSEQMLAAIARGLHLNLAERDHLFALGGHNAPHRVLRSEHVNAGLMRVLDRLADTPAQVVASGTGETLFQTPLATALFGDQSAHTGRSRSLVYRWFTDPAARAIYPPEDHVKHSKFHAARLRETATLDGPRSRAADIAQALLAESDEFAGYWAQHQVGLHFTDDKRIVHPEVGEITLYCQVLIDPDQSQTLLVYTAEPGSVSYERLQLLSVVGTQRMTSATGDSLTEL
jgi:transcriptional regulator with XRE-family HTH domain